MSAMPHASATRDRRQALVFVVLVLAVSWSFEGVIIANGGVGALGPLWIVALMCMPGALSVILRIVMRSGFGDVGFRAGRGRYYALAVAIPLVLAALASVASHAVDVRLLAPAAADQIIQLGPIAALVLGLGLVGAFGEELGWRGFLLPKVLGSGARHPYLVVGVVWAAWHLPLIAFGGFYRTEDTWLMAAVYGVGIVAMSAVFCELRMLSGSVWVATVVHAAHNFVFQFVVPVLLLTAPGTRAARWDTLVGDTGLAIAVLYTGTYFVMHRFAGSRGARRAA